MKRYRVTRTTVETFETEAENIIQAAAIYGRGAVAEELLDTPAYRVTISGDVDRYEHGEYGNPGGAPDCDCKNDLYSAHCLECETQEEGEARVNAVIDREGLWGFIVEKQETVDGEWAEVSGGGGFIGRDPAINGMADYIGADVLDAAEVIYE